MDERVLQQVCQFLQTQNENEAFFTSFWNETKGFYPEAQTKTKVKQWLKANSDYFEIIAGKDGNPWWKIRLIKPLDKTKASRPPTSRKENKEIISKLTEQINKQEDQNGLLFCTICSQKSEIFPSQLQDKKFIKLWFAEHGEFFEISYDQNGGIHSVQLNQKGLKSRKKKTGKAQPREDKKSKETNVELNHSWLNAPKLQQSHDATGKLINFICEKGGSVTFAVILNQASQLIHPSITNNDALFIWLSSNDGLFEMLPNPNGSSPYGFVKVKLSIRPRFCQSYTKEKVCSNPNCTYLHICKAFLCGQKHAFCSLSHEIRDQHNRNIVNQSSVLRKCTDENVNTVLLKTCFPRVCLEYNKNKVGTCLRGENCNFLHVCGDFVLNQCHVKSCSLSHHVASGKHNIEILKKYALLPSVKMPVEMVKTNIAYVARGPPEGSTQGAEASHSKKSKDKKRVDLTRQKRPNMATPSLSNETNMFLNYKLMGLEKFAALSGEQKVENWISSNSGIGHSEREFSVSSDSESVSSEGSVQSSEGSVQSSVASSHDSFVLSELVKKVFMTLVNKYDGSALFREIVKESDLFPAYFNAKKWFQDHPNWFILHSNGRGEPERVNAFARHCRICLDYSSKRGCSKEDCHYFHLCRNLIEGQCPRHRNCQLSHNFNSEHTKQLTKRFHLDNLTDVQLKKLIQLSTPTVCIHHNKGYCNRGENCPNIHICARFVKRTCRQNKGCKFGHLECFETKHAKNVLEQYQMAKNHPKYIKKMLFVFQQRRRDQPPPKVVSEDPKVVSEDKVETEVSTTAAQPEEQQKDDPQICCKFLTGKKCKKCKDMHHKMPYMWQFSLKGSPSGDKWRAFNDNDGEQIEKIFCDVNCTEAGLDITSKLTTKRRTSSSSVRLDFRTMSGQISSPGGDETEFHLRRLESNLKNTTGNGEWFEAQWSWYKFDKLDEGTDKWVQCEIAMASALEEIYREGTIQVNPSVTRRRPAVFISRNEVEEIKKKLVTEQQGFAVSEAACEPAVQSSQPTIPIPTPDVPASREDDYYRVKVEAGTQDYQFIERLLRASVGQVEFEINKLEKITNKKLWKKFSGKMKQMHDALQTSESVNERHLFMPCRHDDVERIVKDNVGVSRLDLPSVLGPGNYFTSNAPLCLERCTENFMRSRFLLVCQVLVGTYTQGSPSTTQYPRRHDGRFYNSLVNDMADPFVFVVPDVDQVYPAFVIDFSYVPINAPEMPANVQLPDRVAPQTAQATNVSLPPLAPSQQTRLLQAVADHPLSGPTDTNRGVIQTPFAVASPTMPTGYSNVDVTRQATARPYAPVYQPTMQGNTVAPPPYSELPVSPNQPTAFNMPGQPPSLSTAHAYPVTNSSNVFHAGTAPQVGQFTDCAKLRPLNTEQPFIPTSAAPLPSQPLSYPTVGPQQTYRQPQPTVASQAPREVSGRPSSAKSDKDCVVM